MKKQLIFKGVGTALITPFKGEKIDYRGLEKIIEAQIDANIDAVIVGGTTGEAATLRDSERYELYKAAHDMIGGRTKLILGTGTNDTKNAIKHTEKAEKIGCDGLLCVTPYYNKGTERGIVEHYKKIADATALPIILYNVPGRTGVNLSLSVIKRLAECENIVGIKEASDSFSRFCALAELGDELWLYSGEDALFYPTLAIGGVGVISVVSNAVPKKIVEIARSFFDGDHLKSRKMQEKYRPFIKSLFIETNPSPIKAVMSEIYGIENSLRLPLAKAEDSTINEVLKEYKAIL